MTRLIFSLILLSFFSSCKKKKYESYLGSYECQVSQHLDSTGNGYNFDTVYTETVQLYDVDDKTIQFLDLPIPYKYIDSNGDYKTSNWESGIYWGREIGLRNDSVNFFHYEGSAEKYWSIRYRGIK